MTGEGGPPDAGPRPPTRASGALRIFLYNWPVYALSVALAGASVAVATQLGGALRALVLAGAGVGLGWAALSLAVSFYIYDASTLAGGTWVPALLPAGCASWANIHAGLDAEVDVDAVMPGRCLARLEIFDPAIMTAPSIARARAITPRAHPATSCTPTRLPLGDGTCDAVVVAFTAHEVRDVAAREAFFDEVLRGLRPGGSLLLVEHVRDVWNLLAFGPGFLHFLPRSEWLRLGARGFTVAREARITPWVMALVLQKPRGAAGEAPAAHARAGDAA